MQAIASEQGRDFARRDQLVRPMTTRTVRIASNNTRDVI